MSTDVMRRDTPTSMDEAGSGGQEAGNQFADIIKELSGPPENLDLKPVFTSLQFTESAIHSALGNKEIAGSIFNTVLDSVNQQLQKQGILPGLKITGQGDGNGDGMNDGYTVSQDSSNPKGSAVIGRSGPAPEQSPEQQQAYEKMGYPEGAKASAPQAGGADGKLAPQTAEGVIPDAEHEKLIKQALELAGEEATPENIKAVNTIVEKESTWNPNAINLTDSNAAAGTPSQGLMQTIPATFQENALPGYDKDITDPLSNLVAGIRYSKSRYGGVQNVPGLNAMANGGGYVGY